MKTDRPVNLNLLAFSFPLAAIVSITHRVTGVILFVGVAFALYALDMALASPEGFAAAQQLIPSRWGSLSCLASSPRLSSIFWRVSNTF